MYENIGKKIKALAKITFIIFAVLSIIGGIAIIAATESDLAAVGLPLLLVGPLVSWISSWVLYGFGELVDKACDIERNTRASGVDAKSKVQAKADNERIKQLEKLRNQGLISEEEYRQAVIKA